MDAYERTKILEKEKFWLNDFSALFQWNLIPSPDLTLNQKLNAFTRLIIIFTIILYAMEIKYWWILPITGIIIIFILKIICGCNNKNREGFSIPPTYVDGAEPMTTISPAFAEEWQSPPPIYDEYTNAPPQEKCGEYEETRPIFGQYISSSRLLPYEDQMVQNTPLNDAQLLMNDEFTRDTLQHRSDLSRGYVNRMNRIYRHGACYDNLSPMNSY